MLLAIDTSAGTSVACSWSDGIAEANSSNSMSHAEVIGDLISQVIADSGQSVGSATGVVAGVGPGPFTGLRVGLAAASAFAVGRNIPLLPVVSHDAVAFEYAADAISAFIVVTDARRKELYWSIYTGLDANGLPERVAGPGLAKPEDVPNQWEGQGLMRFDVTEVSAGALAEIAQRKLAADIPFEPFEPLYLRSPDVTMPTAPKRVSS